MNDDDNEQKFEELAKRWPDLIQKSQQDYIGVGDGWYNIIDILCGMLSRKLEQAKYELKFALEHPDNKYIKPIPELEANLAKAHKELPTILQIKEKFGGLRFYTGNTSDVDDAYISFACAMASRTCEVCGDPGEKRDTGWIKTLCDKHYQERLAQIAEQEKAAEELKKQKLSKTNPAPV